MKTLFITYLNFVCVCFVIGLLVTAGSGFSCKSQTKEDEDSKAIKDNASTKESTETKSETAKNGDIQSPTKEKAKLEFRVVPSQQELTAEGVTVAQIIEKLMEDGPVKTGTDEYVWQEIKNPSDSEKPDQRGFPLRNRDGIPLVIGTYLGKQYVLASNKPEETMLQETGTDSWKLSKCRSTVDQWNRPAVGFSFNEAGTGRFWDLTKAHKNRNLGIFYNNEAIAAPSINTPIFKSGIIEGDFSAEEVQEMVNQLNTDTKKGNILFKLFK